MPDSGTRFANIIGSAVAIHIWGYGMLRELLFDNTTQILLRKTLDKATVAQRVISTNIANVATPGYQRRGVSFDDELRRAMRPSLNKMLRTHPDHLPNLDRFDKLEANVVLVEDGYWNGINNVDIDQENVDLARNQLDFDTASKFIHEEFTSLQTAIRGRL
jgi:flagellar basal-body rod protein FlgB